MSLEDVQYLAGHASPTTATRVHYAQRNKSTRPQGTELSILPELRKLATTLCANTTEEIVRAAAAAMALHNITPKDWDRVHKDGLLQAGFNMGAFRIHLTDHDHRTPLAFLLGLVDTLQDWDRPRFRAPKSEDELILTDQDMSITAKDGRLLLYFSRDARFRAFSIYSCKI